MFTEEAGLAYTLTAASLKMSLEKVFTDRINDLVKKKEVHRTLRLKQKDYLCGKFKT
jgi:hypothetical protein